MKRRPLSILLFLVAGLFLSLWLLRMFPSGDSVAPSSPFLNGETELTAIVILGGGVTPEGKAPPHTVARIEVALEVYKELGGNAVFITLSGGTPHKPNPVDAHGFPVWEATAAAVGLIERGVSPERILEESFSLDTVGNAYYLRAVHLEPAQLRKLIVITNDWHMPRTMAIFDFVLGLPRYTGAMSEPYSVEYRAAPAGITDEHVLQVRKERESSSLDSFTTSVAPVMKSMQEMHRWLFTQHKAYAASRLLVKNKKDDAVSVELLKTY